MASSPHSAPWQEMGSTEAIKQGIKAGIGVSILSRIALIDELTAGSVEIVTIEGDAAASFLHHPPSWTHAVASLPDL